MHQTCNVTQILIKTHATGFGPDGNVTKGENKKKKSKNMKKYLKMRKKYFDQLLGARSI